MMLFYEEKINSKRKSINSNKKNNNNSFLSKNIKAQNASYINSQYITNMKKAKSFFLSKKMQELKNPSNIKMKNPNILEQNKKDVNSSQIKKYSYTFQNFYNNYPLPEPFPKKIDIKIINNDSNFSTCNINDISTIFRNKDKAIYDDKKILFILTNLGLENLFCKFKDNFINYKDLKFLTKDDLIEMKIPIGPRNRINHFIKELKKNGTNLNFEELRNFLEIYKKFISSPMPKTRNENNKIEEHKNYNNRFIHNKKLQNIYFGISPQYETQKKENIFLNDKNENAIKSNNYFFFNRYFKYSI